MHSALRSLALALPLLASSSALAGPAPAASAPSIVEVAQSDGRFTTLVAALKAADLVPALSGPGPLTVFAPTDEAFARLPKGTVEGLLRPERRGDLMRVLTYHVVAGQVLSSDLLKASSAETLAGPALRFGLRVGDAHVVQADVRCRNGVIHVIDAVLLPPEPAPMSPQASTEGATARLTAAIARGAPLYNAGDVAGCVAVYEAAARALVAARGEAGELHALDLDAVLRASHTSADARAWALRRAFDRILADEAFRPRSEAPLPEGFPAAGPVGRVVRKTYPGYRAARADGGEGAFWTLFQHIQANDVKMTAPVEMTLDDGMRSTDMAFLYERPGQGSAGTRGGVAVVDLPAVDVMSIGVRGDRVGSSLTRAREALDARLAADGLVAAGPYRVLGYNSPMVPAEQRFWELQVPVAARPSKP